MIYFVYVYYKKQVKGIDSNEDASPQSKKPGFIQAYIKPVQIFYYQLKFFWNIFKGFTDSLSLVYKDNSIQTNNQI